jgi:hypothetical protein
VKNKKAGRRSDVQLLVCAAFIILASTFSAYAQAEADPNVSKGDYVLKRGDNEFGILGGTSLNTPTLIGTTEDGHLTFVALRYGRVLGTRGGFAFQYTVDAVPVAVVSQPEFVVTQQSTTPPVFTVQRVHRSVYGAGISPIGFKFIFRRRNRVQPFASTSGGFLYFAKQVPAPGSSQFNFTFEFSGGVQLFTASRKSITLGYKFQHVSNGGTAAFNPGLDANVIYAGFSIFK